MSTQDRGGGAARPRPIKFKPLTDRMRLGTRTKVEGWLRHELWTLGEACDLVFNIHPLPVLRLFYWIDTAESELLLDYAVRAVEADSLKVTSKAGKSKVWTVRPADFARWVEKHSELVGKDRAALFGEFFPIAQPGHMEAVRKRVLESSYSTPEFDLALEAVSELWLPWQEGSRPQPTTEEVKKWLSERAPGMASGRAFDRIDALIRDPNAKKGGRK